MELGFIAKAIQRYWWVVVIGGVLGVLAGQVLAPAPDDRYEAEALLQLGSPSPDQAQADDRYVATQLVILRSAALAERVADAIDADPVSVRFNTTFTPIEDTDIVRISTIDGVPQQAADVANAYLDQYLLLVEDNFTTSTQSELPALLASISQLEAQLADVDARISAAVAPYLPPAGSDSDRVIPTIEQIAPALVTERQVLIAQYSGLIEQRNRLQLSAAAGFGSEAVQAATVPTSAIPASAGLLTIAIAVAGLLAGAMAAVVIAHLSPRVLDEEELETLIGVPVAAQLPAVRALARQQYTAVERVPPGRLQRVINELCVRAESSVTSDEALVVVVVGAARSSGVTTTAAAMANRFATGGSRVLLVDANAGHPELTEHYAKGAPGLVALSTLIKEAGDKTVASVAAEAEVLRPTGVPGLSIVGLGSRTDASMFRRQSASEAGDYLWQLADVVVFDAGPLMATAAAADLAQLADAVVLTVSLRHQAERDLQVIARQLEPIRSNLLPVVVPARRRRSRYGRSVKQRKESKKKIEPRPPTDPTDEQPEPAALPAPAVSAVDGVAR